MKLTKRQVMKNLTLLSASTAISFPAQARSRGAGPQVTIILKTDAAPVRRAASDLAADLEKVLGTAPDFAAAPPAGESSVIVIETTGSGGRETFSLHRAGRTITLRGADMRGTIYAIYQFSQDHLGIDPMYFWTDRQPEQRAEIDMPDGERRFPEPVIEYRGFFINDEDQLTGWMPAKPDEQTNIAPALMDKVYETLLRLKANMVVPSTWPFPDDLQIKAASARGLIVNQHHATPVGVNAVRWPKDAPYNFTDHPDVLRRAWKNAVELYDRDQEILWTVGLRGLSDMPYSVLDPNVAGDDAKMGAVIGRAIAEQMEIVRARFPNAKFVTNLWSEGAGLMRDGHLSIPDEVITAWPDQGWGLIKDGGQVRAGQGFYFHVAMLNGRANQLSEMVPVDRIYSEFGRFIAAGATRFALVNVSDMRAVAMTAKTTMDVAWGGVPERADARATYRSWAEAQYGAKAADKLADFYEEYFAALPHAPAGDGYGDGMELGDQHYQQTSRELLTRVMIDPPYYRTFGQSPQWIPPRVSNFGDDNSGAWIEKTVERETRICKAATPGWDRLFKRAQVIEKMIPPKRRDYFRYAILTMLSVNRNGNAMLLAVSAAAQAANRGDIEEARRQAHIAAAQIAEMDRYKSYATYGKWKDWWRGDWLTNIAETADWLATFQRWLADPVNITPLPMIDVDWKAYYHILHYQGSRSVDVS